jgi:uncharacterized membrane protein YeiB
MSTLTSAAGPVSRTERALAPDLVRGTMLLFIALANAANCAFAGQPGLDATPHGLERVVNAVMLLFVDSRAYPVFAVMFGYGLWHMHRRGERSGTGDAALWRRNAWLVAFGLAHATFLYFGDFLGAYGIVGLLCTALLLKRSDRFHRLVLWLWGLQLVYASVIAIVLLAGWSHGSAPFANSANESLSASSFRAAMGHRLTEWPVHTMTVIPFIVIVWLGIWAARRGVVDAPQEHRRLLVGTAAGGLTISVLGAVPYALVGAGWLHLDSGSLQAAGLLHAVSGMYGGPGYVALLVLLARRIEQRGDMDRYRGVVALGRRSLSGYLAQSIAWNVLFAQWALDLGGSTALAVTGGVGTWALTVVLAQRLENRNQPGPAEKVLRRLAYR